MLRIVPSIFVIFFARSGHFHELLQQLSINIPTSLVTLLPGPSQTYRMWL